MQYIPTKLVSYLIDLNIIVCYLILLTEPKLRHLRTFYSYYLKNRFFGILLFIILLPIFYRINSQNECTSIWLQSCILATNELCGYSVQSLSPVGPFYDKEDLGYRNAFKSPEKYLSGGQCLQSPANDFWKECRKAKHFTGN